MEEIILKIRYFKRGLSKSCKKVNHFFKFPTQSLLMDKVIKNKVITLQVIKQVPKNYVINYVLSDQV